MKILELRFKNLNSLYGGWCIDFTDPAFAADGLFAITGATGSGKTTILDALCLALYGQTPRLGRMTQSDNEVMSRQTGECFAEVLFETARGTYRAAWHQHRSRKKANGALQAPKREIAQADGTLLAEKRTEVQKCIDEITGMSFDRFTRSILLAQGSFDTFLKANADERSPILEQITGTEIYTEISKAVHQRASAEAQQLNTLKAGLDGILLLGPEALEQIEFDLKAVEEKHATEAKKRDAAKAALDCATRIQTLQNEFEANRTEQAAWREENEAFRPEAERLTAAKRAAPLAVEHARLINLRNDKAKLNGELEAATEVLPELEELRTKAAADFEITGKRLTEKETVFQELAPVLNQVRSQDTTIRERASALEKERATLKKQEAEHAELLNTEHGQQTELEQLKMQLAKAETYRQEHGQDAELVGQLSAIVQSMELLKKLESEKDDAATAADQAVEATQQAAEAEKTETEKRAVAQTHLAIIKANLKTVSEELETRLDGKTATSWREQLNGVRQRHQLEKRLTENRARVTEKKTEAAIAAAELTIKSKEHEGQERERTLLLENLRLQQKVESLEAERSELVDGQACPLCGAVEHPYTKGRPKPDAQPLEQLNADLTELTRQINELTAQHAAAIAQTEILQRSIETDEAELVPLPRGNADEAEDMAQRIEQIETLEQKQSEAKVTLESARNEQSQHVLAEQAAQQAATSATDKSNDAKARKVETVEAFHSAESVLCQTLEPFGVATLNTAAEQLTSRRDRWLLAEEQQTGLKQKFETLQHSLAALAGQLEKQTTQLAGQSEALKDKTQELDQLVADRQSLFGDQHPDAVEQAAHAELESARKANESAKEKRSSAAQTVELAQQKIETLQKSLQENTALLSESEPRFLNGLEKAGFENEAAWQAARLDEPEHARLEARADQLKQRHTRLTALEAEKTQQLQTERAQKHIETSPEQHAALLETCNELQQQIGGFKDQVKANEKAQALHAERLGEIEKQQTECKRWNVLHELIGSADGKKFRNFAQGLTFELMVSHANRQLAKMSDRYLLVRDPLRPLDLNVVDNYQAGEIRPVKNLSGGESFIVSLSLALGLSKMASKNIRVDSLFLDEGFGTLDEDALETALEALAELKQDGKLIGVISHVAAMKERIGTQISVHTTSGGRSRLSGTGVLASM